MDTADIINFLETVAPLSLQENYDNAGFIYRSHLSETTGVIVCLDVTEAVIDEAIRLNYKLIIAHHPLIFKALKKINARNGISKVLVKAIKNDISIYAIHTNLDNIVGGVNASIADLIGLTDSRVLDSKPGQLKKLVCYVPVSHVDAVREAMFNAGAGNIGNYADCSFAVEGKGTFKAGPGAAPFSGEIGIRHTENEQRLEVILPQWLQYEVLEAMKKAHPYEEVAYDLFQLENSFLQTGTGLVGEVPQEMDPETFLHLVRQKFNIPVIRHSAFTGKKIKSVAVCGGAGSFLISRAISAGADIFLTADLKYHDFFEADGRIILADVGHYESEQFTQDLLVGLLKQKFPNFAVLKTSVPTNPVNYFL